MNDELRPLLGMTAPRHLRTLDPADVRLGERIFRSCVLLFGLLPVDCDDLRPAPGPALSAAPMGRRR